MLKATDLRIGNLLKTPAHYPVKVLQILTDGVQIEYSSGSTGVIPYDNFSFVPLDTEWLERFGFNKTITCTKEKGVEITAYINSNCCIYLLRDEFQLELSLGEEKFILFRNYKKEVHQLQNLYHALTGEELTIKK